ncbi:MAG: hypothetical protein QOJ44_1524, partial [Acidimicrobiaceae bacterium]|nr:hypothetical protein [Acidimicrobiaceae bacterium]
LDCDADSIEAFNRWYDLEHVPPNVSLAGVMSGRRYAAPPDLHALRIADPSSPLTGGRGSFVTIYTLCQPPAEVVASMAELREVLYATGRMTFPAEKKVVRDGGAFELVSAVSSPDLALPAIDVPFVGHNGVLMVRRRGSDAVAAWYHGDWSNQVAELDGVHGVVSLRIPGGDGDELDLVFLEGDVADRTAALRAAVPHHPDVTLVLDAPFVHIDPLRYPWADAIRDSDLPKTIG